MPKRNLLFLLLMIAWSAVTWLARDHAGHGRRFAEVLSQIERSYLEPIDQQALFGAAMEGMFSRLDEHSAFVFGDRRERLENLLDQQFGGVGLELAESDEPRGIVVVSPVRGAPAWRAGVAAGDRIVAIDGEPTQRMPLAEAFRRLRGRPGTPVVLSVAAATVARDVTIVREIVRTESVLGDRRLADGSWDWMIEGEPGVALVRITSFGERTAAELAAACAAVEARLAADGAAGAVILDLRGNAGGLLSTAVEVCDLLLDDGVIVSTRGRSDRDVDGDTGLRDVRRATRGEALARVPMAVLVDGLTASAAEVVAACLQDHRRAVVVGTRTFGKGTVQTILPLSDSSGIVKLTTAEYMRPSRANIHRRGDDDSRQTWGVIPEPGCEIAPTGRQIEALRAWRRHRDIVAAPGRPAKDGPAASRGQLPRHVDPVLAVAIDAVRSPREAGD